MDFVNFSYFYLRDRGIECRCFLFPASTSREEAHTVSIAVDKKICAWVEGSDKNSLGVHYGEMGSLLRSVLESLHRPLRYIEYTPIDGEDAESLLDRLGVPISEA